MKRWLVVLVVLGLCLHARTASAPVLTFTPTSGTFPGALNVGVVPNPNTGVATFITTDGSPASEASTLYTGTIPISSTTTINALTELVGTVRQNTQLTSTGWKICSPLGGGPGTPSSVKCGGVGSIQPAGWKILWNTTVDGLAGVESISLTSTSGAPQILVTLGGSGCDSCTKITMDKWIKPLDSDVHVQNHEHDIWHNNGPLNRLHMVGFQCNQQSGNKAQAGGLAGKQWQVDNEQGGSGPGGVSWVNTNSNDKCPLSSSLWTHIIVQAHWINGDDGCGDGHSPSVHGGLGCTYYDYFEVGTAAHPGDPITMTKHLLGITLQNDSPGWSSGCADQDQVDLNPGGTVANPYTGGVLTFRNNVTCSLGTQATASATYAIAPPVSVPSPVFLHGSVQ